MFLFVLGGFVACGSGGALSSEYPVGMTFGWRLDDVDANSSLENDIKVLDVDYVETSKLSIEAWHQKGMKVMAYLSVGTVDATRKDAKLFDASLLGRTYPDYPQERFLDIRQIDKIMPIMIARLDRIKAKGFDGVELDNIDLHGWDEKGANQTGFSIELADTKRYVDLLIKEAHKRGLSVGQKNATDLADAYVDKFDWALVESAFALGFEEDMAIYTEKGKAVFAVEYTDMMDEATFLQKVCPAAKRLHFYALLKKRDLAAYRRTCP